MRPGGADTLPALPHLMHRLEQRSKHKFLPSRAFGLVVFILLSMLLGLQALKAKDRVFSSALPEDMAT